MANIQEGEGGCPRLALTGNSVEGFGRWLVASSITAAAGNACGPEAASDPFYFVLVVRECFEKPLEGGHNSLGGDAGPYSIFGLVILDVFEREHHLHLLASESAAGIESRQFGVGTLLSDFVGEERGLVAGALKPTGKGVDVELEFPQVGLVSGDHPRELGPLLLGGRVHLGQIGHKHLLDERLEDAYYLLFRHAHLVANSEYIYDSKSTHLIYPSKCAALTEQLCGADNLQRIKTPESSSTGHLILSRLRMLLLAPLLLSPLLFFINLLIEIDFSSFLSCRTLQEELFFFMLLRPLLGCFFFSASLLTGPRTLNELFLFIEAFYIFYSIFIEIPRSLFSSLMCT